VQGLRDVVQVAAGNNFSLALTEGGRVLGWGGNNCGQLGDADRTARFTRPVAIEGLSRIKQIDAGDSYGLALTETGTVWAWGANINGQLGDGTYESTHIPVQVLDPDDPSGYLTGVRKIEAGVRTVVAVKNDGTVRCWGDGEYGQLGKALAAHGPGTPLPFKSLDKADPTGFVTGVQSTAEGRCFTAVLKKDGAVYTWGLDRHGELGLGDHRPTADQGGPDPEFPTTVVHPTRVDSLARVAKIAAGMNHTVALKLDGTVWTWGYNKLMGAGVLGVAGLDGSNVPVRVPALADIHEVHVGFNHNFAVGEDGKIWAWGNARNGRLGPVRR
jgi:alpha-tubulin suppressor-like RCC1 family protein